jgi:hypothetical protein
MIKPGRTKWVRYTARTGEKCVQRFIGEPEGSRPPRRCKRRRKDIIKKGIKNGMQVDRLNLWNSGYGQAVG